MHANSAKNEIALKNLNVLCDIEFILEFLYILPLLETINAYIDQNCIRQKCLYVQLCGCYKVGSIGATQASYYDPYAKFLNLTFNDFNFIESLTNQTLPMNWFFGLNGREDVEYLVFSFVRGKYPIYQSHIVDGARSFLPITKDIFKEVVTKTKDEYEGATQSFIYELESRFP